MKKIFLALICCIGLFLSAKAYTMYGGFSAKEDGETIARIELSSDGRCSIADYETGDRWSGTYNIDRQPTPGDSGILITFNVNGRTYNGTMGWPTQGKMYISFDGRYFELSRR